MRGRRVWRVQAVASHGPWGRCFVRIVGRDFRRPRGTARRFLAAAWGLAMLVRETLTFRRCAWGERGVGRNEFYGDRWRTGLADGNAGGGDFAGVAGVELEDHSG